MPIKKVERRTLFAISSAGGYPEVFLEAFHGNDEFLKMWAEWKTARAALQVKMTAEVPLKDCRKELSHVRIAGERLNHRFPEFPSRWVPVSVCQREMPKNCVRIEIDLPVEIAEMAGALVEHIDSFLKGETRKQDRRGKKKIIDSDIRALREFRKEKEAASRKQTHYIEGLKTKEQDSRSSDVKLSQLKKRARRILRNHKITE